MSNELQLSVGQYSDAGVKPVNQDFYATSIPDNYLLQSKGAVIALADGISSSAVSQIASAAAVEGFISDYYSTPEAWSVKRSAQRVLSAVNSWLYAQTRQSQYRSDPDRGYVCTFSALIIKSTTAYLFSAGDTRIYRVQGDSLEQLTSDHRFYVSQQQSYLTRALGMDQHLEVDYRALSVSAGDVFILATDGIYEFISPQQVTEQIRRGADLNAAAEAITRQARDHQSDDNLSIQIVRIDQLPGLSADEVRQQLTELPFPPELDARDDFDGYTILRKIHSSPRSHVYVARDHDSGETVVLKTPSMELRDDPAYLERFLMEDWVARRINSAHVLKPVTHHRRRQFMYVASEYIDGITLAQWMRDHPRPALSEVRDIATQIAKGLRAFHRLEMIHQDLKPDNIMIDPSGTVKIIDFGTTRVAGIMEMDTPLARLEIPGTAQYSAPEYFLGNPGTAAADVFSLGVIVYQMLSGQLPYGVEVVKARSLKAQQRLRYIPIHHRDEHTPVPLWVDEAIRKALQPEAHKRYQEADEFIYDLSQPNKQFLRLRKEPLIQRNPVQFWQGISALLLLLLMILLYRQ